MHASSNCGTHASTKCGMHVSTRSTCALPDCALCVAQLRRLELLSYEDVSDMELAPMVSCTNLQHLYVDSLFIKQVRARAPPLAVPE